PTFEENPELRNYLTRDYFNNNPEIFYNRIMDFKKNYSDVEPNEAHRDLARYNIPIITMNIDRLHQNAGSKNVIEIHGNLEKIFCEECDFKADFSYIENSINCPNCNSLLQHDLILYGDSIPSLEQAINLLNDADLLLIIGTALTVSTPNYIKSIAEYYGIETVVINQDAKQQVKTVLKKIVS
ncbi:MAG: SIR2 family NAD-dependent protein deacylase, partial [Candidatus Woesearchaeota archaeon]